MPAPDPLTIIEHAKSRKSKVDRQNAGSSRIYKAWRSDDALYVRQQVYDALYRNGDLVDEFGHILLSADFEPQGGGVWTVNVEYGFGQRVGQDPNSGQGGKQPSPEEGIGQETTFDTTGGTAHVTQSIRTIDEVAAPGEEIPDTDRAIGISEHGVQGVEIPVPKFTWTETWRFPAPVINWYYVIRLRDLTGKVNFLPWRNFESGEVRFAGATGHADGPDWIKIAYTFQAEKNRFGEPEVVNGEETGNGGMVVAPGWQPIDKDGWDYLWIAYQWEVRGNTKVQVPIYAKVERVSHRVDFRQLGLGS